MPTKAELKQASLHIKLKIRLGDKVKVIAGKDKGEFGFVAKISPMEKKAFVLKEDPENPDQNIPLNAVIKHVKARYQGEKSMRRRQPSPIDISNLMVIDPNTGEPSRLGRRKEGDKLVRYGKKSNKTLADGPAYTKEEKE